MMKTVAREREIANGVSKRDSRKADKCVSASIRQPQVWERHGAGEKKLFGSLLRLHLLACRKKRLGDMLW